MNAKHKKLRERTIKLAKRLERERTHDKVLAQKAVKNLNGWGKAK